MNITTKKQMLSVRLDPELIERIDNLAPSWNSTRSGMIEFMIERVLPELEEFEAYAAAAAERIDHDGVQ